MDVGFITTMTNGTTGCLFLDIDKLLGDLFYTLSIFLLLESKREFLNGLYFVLIFYIFQDRNEIR